MHVETVDDEGSESGSGPVLSVHILGSGERVPMLHAPDGVPLFYPTLYATSQLRNAGLAANTIRNKLADIAVLIRWERQQGRDLAAEFRAGQLLSLADILSLRDFSMLDMRHLSPRSNRTTPHQPDVLDFSELSAGSQPPAPAVGRAQHYNRMSTMADYLEFLASVMTTNHHSPSLSEGVRMMASTIRKHRPRGRPSRLTDALDHRSPPTEVVDHFMAVGTEGHPQNPFRHPDIQLRNAIIFGLLRATGIRRGELLSLHVEQFDLGHQPRVRILRHQDDGLDSRRHQPVSKTKERTLAIPEELAIKTQYYILEVRPKIGPARRHPYVFVSHKRGKTWGQPLSASALNSQIFAQMRAVDPAFKQMSPHSFRHHFNYELSAKIDAHNARVKSGADDTNTGPIDEARELDIRAYLNGHRRRASGAVYNRRHIREISNRAVLEIQEGLSQVDKAEQEPNASE